MRQEFYRHKKSDGKKWFVTAVMFIVIIAALVLGGMQLWAPDKYKPSGWFSQPKQEQTTDKEQPDTEPDTQNKASIRPSDVSELSPSVFSSDSVSDGYPAINAQPDINIEQGKGGPDLYNGEKVKLGTQDLYHGTTKRLNPVKTFTYTLVDCFFSVNDSSSATIHFLRGGFTIPGFPTSTSKFLSVSINTIEGVTAEYTLDWVDESFSDKTAVYDFDSLEIGLFLTFTEKKLQFFCADTDIGYGKILAEYAAGTPEYDYCFSAFFGHSYSAWLSFACDGADAYLVGFSSRFVGTFYGEAEVPEPPAKTGCTFVGWYYDQALTQPYTDGTKVYANTVLYPRFGVQINIDTQGGESIAPLVVDLGATPQLPTPTRAGYRFMGWQLNGQPYTPEPVTENITITAVWLQGDYIVTFIVDGEIYTKIGVDENSILGE